MPSLLPSFGAPWKYFLSNVLVFFCFFFLMIFFSCSPLSNIVKGMRSLREILRTVETKATQTFKMVRGVSGSWEGGGHLLWWISLCSLTMAFGQIFPRLIACCCVCFFNTSGSDVSSDALNSESYPVETSEPSALGIWDTFIYFFFSAFSNSGINGDVWSLIVLSQVIMPYFLACFSVCPCVPLHFCM